MEEARSHAVEGNQTPSRIPRQVRLRIRRGPLCAIHHQGGIIRPHPRDASSYCPGSGLGT